MVPGKKERKKGNQTNPPWNTKNNIKLPNNCRMIAKNTRSLVATRYEAQS